MLLQRQIMSTIFRFVNRPILEKRKKNEQKRIKKRTKRFFEKQKTKTKQTNKQI